MADTDDAIRLHAFSGGAAEALAARLRAQGLTDADADAEAPEGRLCLIYDRADTMLERALASGGDPGAALAAWAGQARRALALHRRDRARVMVFEAGQAARALPVLRARLGLPDDASPDDPAPDDPGPVAAPDPIRAMIAAHLLAQDPEAHDLARALEAATQPLGNDDGGDGPAAGALLAAWRAPVEQARAHEAALRAIRAETEARDRDAETRLAAAEAARDEARAAVHAAQARAEAAEARAGTARAEADAAQERAALLADVQAALVAEMADLERVSESRAAAIAGLNDEVGDLRAALCAAQAERDAAQAEVARIFASRSMRMTAPLRKVLGLLRRN